MWRKSAADFGKIANVIFDTKQTEETAGPKRKTHDCMATIP